MTNRIWPGRLDIYYQPDDWDWTDSGLTGDELSRVWRRIKSVPNFWMTVPPIVTNVTAIARHRLRYPEDEIYYVTARAHTAGMPVMHQCQQWLAACGIAGLGVGVIVDEGGDKVPIFNSLDCDANVDDKLEAVIQHHAHTKSAYLMDRPWNRKDRPDDLRVVSNLAEFFRRVRKD